MASPAPAPGPCRPAGHADRSKQLWSLCVDARGPPANKTGRGAQGPSLQGLWGQGQPCASFTVCSLGRPAAPSAPLHLADPLLCPSRPRLKLLSGRTPQPPGRGRARVPGWQGALRDESKVPRANTSTPRALTAAARSAPQGEWLCPAWGHTHAPPVAPTDPHSRHRPQPRPGHHSPRTS